MLSEYEMALYVFLCLWDIESSDIPGWNEYLAATVIEMNFDPFQMV